MKNNISDNYDQKLDLELEQAPSNFLFAIKSLTNSDITTCIDVLKSIIPKYEEQGNNWTGSAYCCLAYCYKQQGNWKDAIELAEKGDGFGLNITGYWYYHDVMVNAMNSADRVEDALLNARNAVNFYRERNSILNTSNFLLSKSNILKQLAAVCSKELISYPKAKEYVIEAIEDIVESYSLYNISWDESKEDLIALSNIAARVGVVSDDLNKIYEFKNVQSMVTEFFSPKILIDKAVSENFNKAVDSIKKNDRGIAAVFYEIAYQVAPEDSEENRAFKALICYQCGVNLLYLYKLDQRVSKEIYTIEQINIIKQIQKYWKETIRLISSLSQNFIHDFDRRLPPGLRSAVKNILSDRIMKCQL